MQYTLFPDPKLYKMRIEVAEMLIRAEHLLNGDYSRAVHSTHENVCAMASPIIVGSSAGSSLQLLNARIVSLCLEQMPAAQYVKTHWYDAPDQLGLDVVQFATVQLVLAREMALEYCVDRPQRLSLREYHEIEQQRRGQPGKRQARRYSGWQEAVLMLNRSPLLAEAMAMWAFNKNELGIDDYGTLISWRVKEQRIRQFLIDDSEEAA